MSEFIDEAYKTIKENDLFNNLSDIEKKEINMYVQHISNNLQEIKRVKEKKDYYKNLHKVFLQLINEK